MSFLNVMYQKNQLPIGSSNKNPNRVSGGMRAQGVDHVIFVDESGTEQHVATAAYVNSLESRIKHQHELIRKLEKTCEQMHRRTAGRIES